MPFYNYNKVGYAVREREVFINNDGVFTGT